MARGACLEKDLCSFSKAADSGVKVSRISRYVSTHEADLGAALFARSTRRRAGIAGLAGTIGRSALRRRVAAIVYQHRRRGFVLSSQQVAIRETLIGIARNHGKPVRPAAAPVAAQAQARRWRHANRRGPASSTRNRRRRSGRSPCKRRRQHRITRPLADPARHPGSEPSLSRNSSIGGSDGPAGTVTSPRASGSSEGRLTRPGIGPQRNRLDALGTLHVPANTRVFDQSSGVPAANRGDIPSQH
jgi:hypothetical protein